MVEAVVFKEVDQPDGRIIVQEGRVCVVLERLEVYVYFLVAFDSVLSVGGSQADANAFVGHLVEVLIEGKKADAGAIGMHVLNSGLQFVQCILVSVRSGRSTSLKTTASTIAQLNRCPPTKSIRKPKAVV